jgi:hypothetical protein
MGRTDDLNNDPTPHTAGVSYTSAQDVQAVAVVPVAEESSSLSVPLLSDRRSHEPNDLVEVISPAALPEGYTFDIIVNHKPFTITVVCRLRNK